METKDLPVRDHPVPAESESLIIEAERSVTLDRQRVETGVRHLIRSERSAVPLTDEPLRNFGSSASCKRY